jgi:hypothetical protein
MTPDEVRGGYAAVVMIGEGTYKMKDVLPTVRWHQDLNLWLAGRQWSKLYRGMPVVARMAGESNELVMLGIVCGNWEDVDDEYADGGWPFQIEIAWESHVTRGVLAREVLGSLGKSRPAVMTVSRAAWKQIVSTMLDA